MSRLFWAVWCAGESGGVQHSVFGDVLDVKWECELVDVRSDVDEGNIGNVLRDCEVVESEIFDGGMMS